MVQIRILPCKDLIEVPSFIKSVEEVHNFLYKKTGLKPHEFYFLHQGKKYNGDFSTNEEVQLIIRVFGGKGGFGSMLRAIGTQIQKTTNKESCRDLNGRRLRDINEEKRVKSYLEKQKSENKNPEDEFRKKIEKLTAKTKVELQDEEYDAARTNLTENIDDAVEMGLRKIKKAKIEEAVISKKDSETIPKKKKNAKGGLWLGGDFSTSSDESEAEASV